MSDITVPPTKCAPGADGKETLIHEGKNECTLINWMFGAKRSNVHNLANKGGGFFSKAMEQWGAPTTYRLVSSPNFTFCGCSLFSLMNTLGSVDELPIQDYGRNHGKKYGGGLVMWADSFQINPVEAACTTKCKGACAQPDRVEIELVKKGKESIESYKNAGRDDLMEA